MILINHFSGKSFFSANNFEFVVDDFRVEKVKICTELVCGHISPYVKMKRNRFVLKSSLHKIS